MRRPGLGPVRYRCGKLVGRACQGRPVTMGRLWPMVKEKLGLRWSPRQIERWLRQEFPDRPEQWVSHETIYQALYYKARGGAARRAGPAGRPAQRARQRQPRPAWPPRPGASRGSRTSTSPTRPAEVDDRAVPGHWEGDLVIGARVSQRDHHPGRTRHPLRDARRATPRRVSRGRDRRPHRADAPPARPAGQTLTWDQGSELAHHARLHLATGCQVYFCDPHSPWQRGTNENTNGLLRQYFPKGSTDFRTLHPRRPRHGRPRTQRTTTSNPRLGQPGRDTQQVPRCNNRLTPPWPARSVLYSRPTWPGPAVRRSCQATPSSRTSSRSSGSETPMTLLGSPSMPAT